MLGWCSGPCQQLCVLDTEWKRGLGSQKPSSVPRSRAAMTLSTRTGFLSNHPCPFSSFVPSSLAQSCGFARAMAATPCWAKVRKPQKRRAGPIPDVFSTQEEHLPTSSARKGLRKLSLRSTRSHDIPYLSRKVIQLFTCRRSPRFVVLAQTKVLPQSPCLCSPDSWRVERMHLSRLGTARIHRAI